MTIDIPYHISNDDYDKLVALLDDRRLLVARHLRSKRLSSRSKLSLAAKLEIDRQQKAELAELNARIEALTKGAI